jgi:hypothetical protein
VVGTNCGSGISTQKGFVQTTVHGDNLSGGFPQPVTD